MIFIRSNSGLSNRAQFTGTRFTLYVEGGGGVEDKGSSDVVFWQEVLQTLAPELEVTISTKGGKPQLEAIARKIESGAVHNTIVAMDADFDHALRETIKHRHILYTHGYSWENDLFDFDCIEKAVAKLGKIQKLKNETRAQLDHEIRKIKRYFVINVNRDFHLRNMNKSLFPQISAGKYIKIDSQSGCLQINYSLLRLFYRAEIEDLKSKGKFINRSMSVFSSQCFLHGHTMQFLVKFICTVFIRKIGRNINVTDDLIENAFLPIFAHLLRNSNSEKAEYYRGMISRL